MADALSRKNVMIASFIIATSLIDKISALQEDDQFIKGMSQRIREGNASDFQLDSEGVLRLEGRICVPDVFLHICLLPSSFPPFSRLLFQNLMLDICIKDIQNPLVTLLLQIGRAHV